MNMQTITNYTDFNNNIHIVRHSTLLPKEGVRELEERIMEDLYRIFSSEK